MRRSVSITLVSVLSLAACEGEATEDAGGVGRDAALATHDSGTSRDAMLEVDATPVADGGSDAGGTPGRTYSTDPSTFPGSPRCNEGFLLCDSFEGPASGEAPDPSIWSMPDNRNGNSIVVDGTRAMRGSQALHITTLDNSPETFIYNESIFPAASDEHWGRAFFYVEDPLPILPGPALTIHWTLAELVARHDDDMRNILPRVVGGVTAANSSSRFFHNFLFNYEQRPRSPGFNESGLGHDERIASDVWHCVEWYVNADRVEARFFWNGTERDDLHVMGFTGDDRDIPIDFNPFQRLNVGWTIYQTNLDRAWSVWIDDVAVDDERIGCNN